MHEGWKGLVDVLEHSAYCDGQREEDEEGFFFDNTRAEYDSDADADPFANNYLTEDEIEFSEDYVPAPYVPGRVMDAIWHAFSVKKVPIGRLVSDFGLPTHRISAIINLKAVSGKRDPYKGELTGRLRQVRVRVNPNPNPNPNPNMTGRRLREAL